MLGIERSDLLATQQKLGGERGAARFALWNAAIEDLEASWVVSDDRYLFNDERLYSLGVEEIL